MGGLGDWVINDGGPASNGTRLVHVVISTATGQTEFSIDSTFAVVLGEGIAKAGREGGGGR